MTFVLDFAGQQNEHVIDHSHHNYRRRLYEELKPIHAAGRLLHVRIDEFEPVHGANLSDRNAA